MEPSLWHFAVSLSNDTFACEKKKSETVKVLVTQSCLTLCDPMDCSPPGSSVHGILQGRVLEWVAFPFSRGSSQPRGSNSGLSHRRQILYHLSHQGSARKRRTLMLFQVKHGWLRRRKKIKRSPKSPGRTGLRWTPWKIIDVTPDPPPCPWCCCPSC